MSNVRNSAIVLGVIGVVATGLYIRSLLRNKAKTTIVEHNELARKISSDSSPAPMPVSSKLSALVKFKNLMQKYAVPVDNNIEVGGTCYLDKPVIGRLFTGIDNHGRAFINIPVKIKYSDTPNAVPTRVTFTVFQRYTTREDAFVMGRAPTGIDRDTFLSLEVIPEGSFATLEVILSGRMVTLTHAQDVYIETPRSVKVYIDTDVAIASKQKANA